MKKNMFLMFWKADMMGGLCVGVVCWQCWYCVCWYCILVLVMCRGRIEYLLVDVVRQVDGKN